MYIPVLVVGAAIGRADVSALADRLVVLLLDGAVGLVVCDVTAITEPDAGTLDALARLQFIARRLGGRVLLRGAHGRLRSLVTLTGLDEVLPLVD